jgi:hypothetical protein
MVDLSHCYLHCLGEAEEKKLQELRARVPSLVQSARERCEEAKAQERLTIWGVDLEAGGDAADIILLKFLRAEDLDLEKAAERIAATLAFRAECQIDALMSAELPEHFRGHDTVGGVDVDGRPILLSRFGAMDLPKVFGDVEAFVRYRAHFMEKAIALLSFKRGEPEDLCQIHDYSGVPLLFQTAEVKGAVSAVSKVFEAHYPEFKGRTVFVNFPAAFSKMFKAFSNFLPERTRKKFVILGEKDQEDLFKLLPPEHVPDAIGGMKRNPLSPLSEPVKMVTVRARTVEEVVALELPAGASSTKVSWELRVCFLEIGYEVVFVPAASGSKETVIRKSEPKQYLQAADGVVSGEWTASEAGSVLFRFANECAWFKARLCLCRAGGIP